jgi:2-polyprenyl-3-methyl-5-hydroxy-6-metoxy-1,4-benzoquinol methylase
MAGFTFASAGRFGVVERVADVRPLADSPSRHGRNAPMTDDIKKGEAQYRPAIELIRSRGLERMGLHASWAWYSDPKRMAFTFARYKFVAKMLEGSENVLEFGCADGFCSRVVRQSVKALTAVDFDADFINSAKETVNCDKWPIDFRIHDVRTDGPLPGKYDGVYCLDVLEHIPAEEEHVAIAGMIEPLLPDGTCIIGMPSLQSQQYASPLSKEGHVNCKDQRDFKKLMLEFFRNVYMFSMNDEVVHTGYHAMSHYNIALCCGKRTA